MKWIVILWLTWASAWVSGNDGQALGQKKTMIGVLESFRSSVSQAPESLGATEQMRTHLNARLLFEYGSTGWVPVHVPDILADPNHCAEPWRMMISGAPIGDLWLQPRQPTGNDWVSQKNAHFFVASPEVVPLIHQTHPIFRWATQSVSRPIVVSNAMHARPVFEWVPTELSHEALGKLRDRIHTELSVPRHVLSDIQVTSARRNQNGEVLIALACKTNDCPEWDGDMALRAEINMFDRPEWFYLGKEIKYLGCCYQFLDDGDYNNDGIDEVLFTYSAYNRDGFVLFDQQFSRRASVTWTYH